MRVRNVGSNKDEKIEVQMTPMIDIVFQLLVFFIMTFKIVSQEGDFNIKMPLGTSEGVPDSEKTPPIKIRLQATTDGSLKSISLNNNNFGVSFDSLHDYIISLIGDDRGPNSVQATTEVELDCDYNLRYDNVIRCITAVSGYIDADDNLVKLVEKIKFAPPKPSSS